MISQERRLRQSCCLDARIFVPRLSSPIRCTITDISTLGAFVRPHTRRTVPASFDLSIGGSSLPRACRIARLEAEGFDVEFIEPVRQDVEEILVEHAFKEEMMFDALYPSLEGELTMTKVRLRQTADAIMELIEERNAMTWRPADVEEAPELRRLIAYTN